MLMRFWYEKTEQNGKITVKTFQAPNRQRARSYVKSYNCKKNGSSYRLMVGDDKAFYHLDSFSA